VSRLVVILHHRFRREKRFRHLFLSHVGGDDGGCFILNVLQELPFGASISQEQVQEQVCGIATSPHFLDLHIQLTP